MTGSAHRFVGSVQPARGMLTARTRLEHARANGSDLRCSIERDTTVLGLELTWPPDDPNYAHFVNDGGAVFAIQETAGRGGRFNFTVDDPAVLWQELQDRAPVIESLHKTAYGTTEFTIADPDGNELGFVDHVA